MNTNATIVMREARERNGLTQAGLAQIVGSMQIHIAKMERGERRISPECAVKIAEALSINAMDLLDDDGRKALTQMAGVALANLSVADGIRHSCEKEPNMGNIETGIGESAMSSAINNLPSYSMAVTVKAAQIADITRATGCSGCLITVKAGDVGDVTLNVPKGFLDAAPWPKVGDYLLVDDKGNFSHMTEAAFLLETGDDAKGDDLGHFASFAIDSSQVRSATGDLDKYVAAGEKADAEMRKTVAEGVGLLGATARQGANLLEMFKSAYLNKLPITSATHELPVNESMLLEIIAKALDEETIEQMRATLINRLTDMGYQFFVLHNKNGTITNIGV